MPRCASTSIVDVCEKEGIEFYGGLDMGFWGNMHTKPSADYLHQCVLNHVGKEVYADSFVFSSVRNPYSRAVSMYKHDSWNSVKTFPDFCDALKKNEYPSKCARWHTSTLTEHLVDTSTLKVDFVIKFENLQHDFNTVSDKLGIPHQPLPYKNTTKHKHYTEYYDDQTRQVIAEKYAKDIEYFGYEFGE